MVFGGCYASLSRRSSKPSLPSLTCAPCLLPRKISAAISASHQENGRTKTQSGKLAPMGATLVVAPGVPVSPFGFGLARQHPGSLADLHPRDFPVLDLDQIDARYVLGALLAGRTLLDKSDVAADTGDFHVPQRLLDRRRLGFACGFDGCSDGQYPVIATETLGQAADIVAARLPLTHEFRCEIAVLHRLGKPRREENEMHRAVGGFAGLLDQLIGRVGAAGRNDAGLELLFPRLLENERDLLDRRGDEQRVAAG